MYSFEIHAIIMTNIKRFQKRGRFSIFNYEYVIEREYFVGERRIISD